MVWAILWRIEVCVSFLSETCMHVGRLCKHILGIYPTDNLQSLTYVYAFFNIYSLVALD